MATTATEHAFSTGDDKKQVGIKLTAEARRLRAALARKLGVDQTAVVELAIRQMAQREDVK